MGGYCSAGEKGEEQIMGASLAAPCSLGIKSTRHGPLIYDEYASLSLQSLAQQRSEVCAAHELNTVLHTHGQALLG